jgi:hypothetical protein
MFILWSSCHTLDCLSQTISCIDAVDKIRYEIQIRNHFYFIVLHVAVRKENWETINRHWTKETNCQFYKLYPAETGDIIHT